jgi:hypothetical protein
MTESGLPVVDYEVCCTQVGLMSDWHGESCSATPIYRQLSYDTNLGIARNDLSIAVWQWRNMSMHEIFDPALDDGYHLWPNSGAAS